MSHRLPVSVAGLTAGDYLLWSWSSNGNHAVLALVSGLTLPPLAAACVWLLVLTLVRFIASGARRSLAGARGGLIASQRSQRARAARRTTAAPRTGAASAAGVAPAASVLEDALVSASGASSEPASRTLAA